MFRIPIVAKTTMDILNIVTFTLAIIAGINRGPVEAAQFDLVAAVAGGQDAILAWLLSLLFCLLALWKIIPLLRAGGAGRAVAQESR